jgi:pimeloyl-ACP methyl ester carboxylesterase
VQALSKRRKQQIELTGSASGAYLALTNAKHTEWIVLVPGAGATSAIWTRQIRAFARLANLLFVELRGHGRLPKVESRVPYSFDLIASDVIACLNREGIGSAHFVGLSLGCVVAETLARDYPGRVKSLTLVGGIVHLDLWARMIMNLGIATKRVVPYMALYRLFTWVIMPGVRHRRTRKLFHMQARRLGRAEFLRWYSMAPSVEATLEANRLRPSSVQTLFIMGAQDYMFGRHAHHRAIVRNDTRVATVPGAGHVCNIEQPMLFNAAALEFLGRQITKDSGTSSRRSVEHWGRGRQVPK